MELPNYYKQWVTTDPLLLKDQPNDEYHAGTSHISNSWLKSANDSLFEFLMYPLREKNTTPALRLGSLVHTMLQEPEKLEKEFAFFEGFTTKDAKAGRDVAISNGLTPATYDEKERAEKMIELCKQDPLVIASLKQKNIEHSFYWNADFMDEDDIHVDLPLKSRLDQYFLLKDDTVCILDVKTSSDIHNYNKSIANFHYDQQAAMQVEAIRVSLKKEVSAYYYLFIQNEFPFDYRLVALPLEYIQRGDYKNQQLLSKIKRAILTETWTDRRVTAALPTWYI